MLQIWLPLNGNLDNQGLLDCTVESNNITFADGIIGKAASYNADSSKRIFIKSPPEYQDNFSWCCWCYCKSTTSNVYQFILSQGRDYASKSLSLAVNASGKLIIFNANSQTNTTACDMIGKWTHLAVTVQNKQLFVYINGALSYQYTTSAFDYSESNDAFVVGKMAYGYTSATTYFPFNGSICDVRVYDHALSPKEVQLVGQGLILHYPLHSPYMEPVTNLYGNRYENGNASIQGGFAKSVKIDDDGLPYTNYTFTKQPATANNWYYLRYAAYPFTAGRTYTISMDVRVNGCENCGFTLRHARLANDYFGCRQVNVVTASLVGKGWLHYSLTQVIPATFTHNSETKTCAPLVELYTGNLAVPEGQTTVRSMDFDIRKVQVIEKDHDLPYTPESNPGSVCDCSGFCNHGTIAASTSPTWDASSIRYRGCYKFSANQFITVPQTAKIKNSITVSVWGYMETWTANQRLISCTEGGGWNIESNGGNISFPVYVSTIGYISAISNVAWTSLSKGWHNFAGTYDGINLKIFLDGKLVGTNTTGKTAPLDIGYNAGNTIFIGAEAGANASTPAGTYFNGKLSDVRIYCTALTEKEILELYSVSLTITNSGACMARGEFIEL